MPSGPGPRARNPFDGAVKPGAGRPLADRISRPSGRDRSLSPGRDGDDDVAPKGIDRYIPGGNGSRSRSPFQRGRRDGRRPGERRGDGGRQDGRGGPRAGRDSRARKTQDELDAEMADYFNTGGGTAQEDSKAAPVNTQRGTAQTGNDDDMIG